MKAKVNEELFAGRGSFEEICLEVFEVENDVSKVRVDTVPPEAEDSRREAKEECKTEAIFIEE